MTIAQLKIRQKEYQDLMQAAMAQQDFITARVCLIGQQVCVTRMETAVKIMLQHLRIENGRS